MALGALAALGGLAGAPTGVSAQEAAVTQQPSTGTPQRSNLRSPVLLVDVDTLYAQTAFGKALAAQIQTREQALAAENRQIEAALAAEELDLTRSRADLSVADFTMLADAFDERVTTTRRTQLGKERALKRLDEEYRRRVFPEEIQPILASLMVEFGAAVILRESAVFMSFDAVNITSRAQVRLDAAFADGALSLPEPDAPATANTPDE